MEEPTISREKWRYHNDLEFRERRQLAGRNSYLKHAEKKRASVYSRLVRMGFIKNPKQLERYGLSQPPVPEPLPPVPESSTTAPLPGTPLS